jgi:hypothetical protein
MSGVVARVSRAEIRPDGLARDALRSLSAHRDDFFRRLAPGHLVRQLEEWQAASAVLTLQLTGVVHSLLFLAREPSRRLSILPDLTTLPSNAGNSMVVRGSVSCPEWFSAFMLKVERRDLARLCRAKGFVVRSQTSWS